MKKIVFLDEYSVSDADLTSVKRLGDYTGYDFTSPEQIVERASDAEILIVNKVRLTAEIIGRLPRLELICEAATGTDNIDLDAAAKRGIPVMNAKGYSTDSVVEATIGGAIGLLREVVYYDGYVKDGCYSSTEKLFNYDRPTRRLSGRRWGIIGMGTIGRRVAAVASALGCSVAYHSPSGVAHKEDYPAMPLHDLLRWADVVSIHSPLNDKTRNLLDTAELSMMKRDAILINVARGGIVNERALAEALDAGTIAGAAVDVFSREPLPADSPLLSVADPYKLLLSPHNAWSARESIDNLVAAIASNIERFLAGER